MKDTALLIIDFQKALVMEEPYALKEVVANINRLIKECRDNNIEVIYIQHCSPKGTDLEPNTEGWKIYEALAPKEGDTVISKNYNSSFKETSLEEYLAKRGIIELILTGMQTEYCFDTTCKVAFEKGFKVYIPEMTNTTFDNEFFTAETIYNYYNYKIFNKRFAEVKAMNEIIDYIKSK